MAAPKLDSSLTGSPVTLFPIGVKAINGKFLTVESFGDQLNCDGTALRSKQVFQLETDGNGLFAFKSHRGKYLHADLEVHAKSEARSAKELFNMQYRGGVVTLQAGSGKFLSVKDGKVELAGAAGPNEEFEIVINFHPQVCLMTQKRYLTVEGVDVKSQRATQFGRETLFTMVAADNDPSKLRGVYCLRAQNGKYLVVEGGGNVTATGESKSDDTHLALQFHGNCMAILALKSGKYLTAQGAGVKASRTAVGAKEIFQLFDSDAQIVLRAFNGKYVTIQGQNLICGPDTISNDVIFLFEHQDGKWAFKTINEDYITTNPGFQIGPKTRGADELFTLEHLGKQVAFKTGAGKYVTAKPLGGFEFKGELTDGAKFELYFYNRPQVVFLTSTSSFIGVSQGKVVTNKTLPENWNLEFKDGTYAVQDPESKKYMKVGADGKVELEGAAQWFFLEFHMNKLALKTQDGKYLTAEQQGWLVAKADKAGPNELYEF